jgi:membrane associated rhomboid family serine protease/antitoxin component YwqK of YwqJK toxin-antitoxin module
MDFLRRHPFTIILIIGNIIAFGIIFLEAGTFGEPQWTRALLKEGALFNPYALEGEWYRLFTHQFLHGGIFHLLLNMYALYFAGSDIEQESGSGKFLAIYFLSGLGAAFSSLYWNLFVIGVGASGAIFGLFGYSIVHNVAYSLREGLTIKPIIVNFIIFIAINLLFSQAMNVDDAAHIGGLATGAALAMLSVLFNRSPRQIKFEYAFAVLFIFLYFLMPRDQVTYFKTFQKVLETERAGKKIFDKKNITDQQFLEFFREHSLSWDTALMMLDAQRRIPAALQNDTLILRRYIKLGNQEAKYRIRLIENESYVYMDSIGIVQDSMQRLPPLKYPLAFGMYHDEAEEEEQKEKEEPKGKMTQVYYDSNWVEIDSPPAAYYRIGYRDSLGHWNGPVRDYYATGDVQMKGAYKADRRNGIFLYYSDHRTYTSAGRYVDNRSVGKWETFHDNGKLESEVYYDNGYFLKSLWDSAGNPMVKDGSGKQVTMYSNGIVATEGEYKDGHKEGYWYGRHPDGGMYFEENYRRGRLVNGRSRSRNGRVYLYDESSFFPIPEGGYQKLSEYLKAEASKYKTNEKGEVKLSFRVTVKSVLTDFTIEDGLSVETERIAKEIILRGPKWIPAKEHGDKPVDGFAYVTVLFE